jgi:hypothetical protein
MNMAIAMAPTMLVLPSAGEELTGSSHILGMQGKQMVKLAPVAHRSHRVGTAQDTQAIT